MRDHFAVLGLERRPGLPESVLKEAYYEKSRLLHPDRIRNSDFAAVNEAFQIISNPATRIQHLLRLEFGEVGERQIGSELAGLFELTVKVLGRADQELDSISRQSSSLLRALAFQRLDSVRGTLDDAEKQIIERQSELHRRVIEIDQIWFRERDRCQKSLAQIAVDLTFVQKWLAQLRQRRIRLEEVFVSDFFAE